jgi:hypothetical protein
MMFFMIQTLANFNKLSDFMILILVPVDLDLGNYKSKLS